MSSKDQEINSEKPKSSKRSNKVNVDSSLNLRPSGEISLKDFYEEHICKSNLERNVVFVFYLKNILKLNEIGAEQINACYIEVEEKIPNNIRQSIVDTKIKLWLDYSSMDDINLSTRGFNHISDIKSK